MPKAHGEYRINPVKIPLDISKCGQRSNFIAHLRRGERPCDACYKANSAYNRKWKKDHAEPKPRVKATFNPARCGTAANHAAHKRYGVPVCGPCRKAYNLSRRGKRMKTECPQGHEYDAENTAYYSNGRRRCRACAEGHNDKPAVVLRMPAFLSEMYAADEDELISA